MRLSVIIPSRNEGDWLVRTVKSILHAEEGTDMAIIHVDDASSPPEPDMTSLGVKQIRLPRRRGASMARALGMFEADGDAIFTCDAHCLFSPGDSLAALIEENQRFVGLGALPPNYNPPAWQVKASLEERKISRLGEMCIQNESLGYMGPCRMGAATLRQHESLFRVGWLGHVNSSPIAYTAAPFGGNYMFSRHALEVMGGYPQLGGYFGFEEEAVALLAAGKGLKILCATELSPWHVYRSQGIDPIPCPHSSPEDKQLENLAGVYRLAFGERMWQDFWRPTLASTTLRGRAIPIPEYVLRMVESPEFTEYRDAVQENFLFRDESLVEEVKKRSLADQQLQGEPDAV